MHNVAVERRVVDVDRCFYTLIPSRFPTIRPFARIANDRDEEVAELESLTNPRLREKDRLTGGHAVVDGNSPRLQNWNHAPFAYLNPEGSRYFGPETAVLELADDLQTALAVSIRKREMFLGRTREPQIGCEMRVLKRGVKGRFADLTSLGSSLERTDRLAVGIEILALGVDGLLFRPPERPTAECVAILRGETLDRAVQGDHFKFAWEGCTIASLYSFTTGKSYKPLELTGAADILAA